MKHRFNARAGRLALLLTLLPLMGLTAPITGAVAFPQSHSLRLPFPAGSAIRISAAYSPSGGSSLHADTNATNKANDHYALDLVYDDEPDGGLGLPVLAPLDGTVVKAGWATAGWANYGQRVILAHDLGDGHVYHSLYAHLNAIDDAITEGAEVTAGQVLGELGRSCQQALSCVSFSGPHLHWSLHRDSSVGGSGTGGSYGGNAVVPEPLDGAEDLAWGDVIASSNTQEVVCGDGFCSAGEEDGGCPVDCPVCEPVPSEGRVVDDSELCFIAGGSAAYWYTADDGIGGVLKWTHTTDSAAVDNHGIWSLSFEAAGDYVVEAHMVDGFSEATLARYRVTHGGETTDVLVDQSPVSGWRTLGTFSFTAGDGQSVRLDDNTGEAFSTMTRIGFDAIRVTPVVVGDGDGVGDGDAPADAGVAPEDAGAPVVGDGDADADAPPDAGVDEGDAGMPVVSEGDAGGGDGDGDREAMGCAGGCSSTSPSMLGLFALLLFRRRRTWRCEPRRRRRLWDCAFGR